ncbi:MAG: hypothetical protein AAF092_16165 [Pseudomonadota bacterium]
MSDKLAVCGLTEPQIITLNTQEWDIVEESVMPDGEVIQAALGGASAVAVLLSCVLRAIPAKYRKKLEFLPLGGDDFVQGAIIVIGTLAATTLALLCLRYL